MATKTAKKFKVRKKFAVTSVASLRNRLVWEEVHKSLTHFLKGDQTGICFVCNTSFTKRHRWHSLCSAECYSQWIKGQIRPRNIL